MQIQGRDVWEGEGGRDRSIQSHIFKSSFQHNFFEEGEERRMHADSYLASMTTG